MIKIKVGDITKEEVDVIVNAANSKLSGGGGVDGAIHRVAGSTVLEECKKIGGCETGNGAMTNAGKLKAKKIIHAVGPVWHNKGDEDELLKKTYERSFLMAKENKLKSIALPAISTGAYGFPKERAAKIALTVGKRYENDFKEIRFVCFSDSDYEVYKKVWRELKG